jgi:hypothetical protein
VDACLFAQLVDFKDKYSNEYEILATKSYRDLWIDMRKAVDRCHRDGVIKGTVAKDPSKYIIFDENCKNH